MGDYYQRPWPTYEPDRRKPKEPDPPAEPSPEEKDLLGHYQALREEISRLESIVGDDKELDKAVVLLKVGCKLVKRRLRRIGFTGPLRTRFTVSECG